MNKKWEICKKNNKYIKEVSEKYDISESLATILYNRDIKIEDIPIFLNPTRDDFYDPLLMPDMEKATARLIEAIKNKEKILIYGDYDVDGITSISVLKKFLKGRGLDAGIYLPNRLNEGYGLNADAVKKINDDGYNLIITVDCGISAIQEVELANSLGMQVIITDHHEPLEELPKAYAVVDTKRKDNKYPFRELAGVGVVFKLIQAISKELGLNDKEYLKYLDLVCIGTISDIVPLVSENRVIAKLGLKLVNQTSNIGLYELIKSIGYAEINVYSVSFGIAPRINACGRMGHEQEALQLLLTEDIEEAKKITKNLNKYNLERQEIEHKIYDDAIEEIEKNNLEAKNSIILGSDKWHHGVIGIVASKITEKYYRPTILVNFEDDIGKGSGRSISNFDLHEALVATSSDLIQYGGHAMAIGLTVEKSKFELFKEEFEEYAAKKDIKSVVPTITIDEEITKKQINLEFLEEIKKLEPFGEKNKEPVFIYKNLKINSIRTLSEGKHIKLVLKDENLNLESIGFNLGYLADDYLIGDRIDVVGYLTLNEYNGRSKIQINIIDIKKSV